MFVFGEESGQGGDRGRLRVLALLRPLSCVIKGFINFLSVRVVLLVTTIFLSCTTAGVIIGGFYNEVGLTSTIVCWKIPRRPVPRTFDGVCWYNPYKATAEEAATLPPSIERLSVGSNGSPSKPSLEALLDASENDEFDEGDDAETQLQNTIAHIERLILTSRKVKKESPGGHIVSNAAITGRHDDTGVGEGLEGMAEEGDSEVAEGRAGSNGGGARGRRPPTIDRTALLSRRQSTSFFDTKPVFSARDASASFSKAWNGTGTIGGGAGEGGGGRFGLATASRGGAGRGTGDEGNNDGTRWAKTTRAAYSRRQTERWGFKGDDDVVVGTPPTVEGSAGSSSGSPPHGCVGQTAAKCRQRGTGKRKNAFP